MDNPAVESFTERPRDHAFTYQYSQPREYHFCLDSIIFAYCISRRLAAASHHAMDFRALDVCAGCGVVGIELAYYHPWIERFDFVELQEIFRPHFEENLRIAQRENKAYRFLRNDLKDFAREPAAQGVYDLIVANPPYFRPGEGLRSPNEVRHRARFFEDLAPQDLLTAFARLLKPGGRAYFLMRPGEVHGRGDDAELTGALSDGATWSVVADVRGTAVVEVRRSLAAIPAE